MTEIEIRLSRGHIDPVYVLVSDEPILLDRILAAIKDAALPPATRAFNLDALEPKAGTAAILVAARTIPMLGRLRMVLVKGADTFKAEDLEIFSEYMDNPSSVGVLVLTFEKADGRMKFFREAKRRGFFHELLAPKQIWQWVRDEAKKYGVEIRADACDRLVDRAGKDMTLLAGLIDQLSLYANGVITVQHVDDLVPEARERTVFELANAVAPGKREASYRVIAKLFEQRGSAIGMAAIMARHYRQLMQTKWHLDEGGRTEELSKILGVPPFAVAGLVEQARAHTDKAIYKAVSLLAEADRDLKGPARTALGERIIIERLADRLIDLLPQKEKVEW